MSSEETVRLDERGKVLCEVTDLLRECLQENKSLAAFAELLMAEICSPSLAKSVNHVSKLADSIFK